MKRKILTIAFAIIMTGSLAACGSKDTQEPIDQVSDEAEEEDTQEAALEDADEDSNQDVEGPRYLSELKAADYVTLGEYKGVEVELEEPEAISDEDFEKYIEIFLTYNPFIIHITDRSVEEGDTVNIDYEGKLDGVAFAGGTAQGADLVIGSHRFIDGFEDGVIGMELGETRDLDLAFPDPYDNNPDLAGKQVVFTVTVNDIAIEQEVSELSDEYVASLDIEDCSTVEEFRKIFYEELSEQFKESFRAQKMNAVLEIAEANAVFKEMPEGMLKRFEQHMTPEEALQSVQHYILVAAIAGEEGIEVTEEEFNERLSEDIAGYMHYGFSSEEEFRQSIDEEAYKELLLAEKVSDFLGENAVVVSAPVE